MLDSLIKPDWGVPLHDQKEKEKILHDETKSRISKPSVPVRYYFNYQLLEGDEYGRAPNDPKKEFNYKSTSGLQEICQSQHNTVSVFVNIST